VAWSTQNEWLRLAESNSAFCNGIIARYANFAAPLWPLQTRYDAATFADFSVSSFESTNHFPERPSVFRSLVVLRRPV
jgi:hypothetical protein